MPFTSGVTGAARARREPDHNASQLSHIVATAEAGARVTSSLGLERTLASELEDCYNVARFLAICL
jgi:hypothetical protein